jgi:hypothetical protein
MSEYLPQTLEPVACIVHRPGEPPPKPLGAEELGVMLVERHDLYGFLISLGQARSVPEPYRPLARFTHAALLVGSTLTEARARGVVATPLAAYSFYSYVLVVLRAEEEMRRNAVLYAEVMRRRHTRYGWLDILSLAAQCLTHDRISVTREGTLICSALVAEALERLGAIWPRPAQTMRPVDLAIALGVRP